MIYKVYKLYLINMYLGFYVRNVYICNTKYIKHLDIYCVYYVALI